MERINDILHLEKDKEVKLSDNVKKGICELHEELHKVFICLQQVEAGLDDGKVLSEQDKRYCLELRSIANSSDDVLNSAVSNGLASGIHNIVKCILNRGISNNDVARDIHNIVKYILNRVICNKDVANSIDDLVKSIRYSSQLLSSQPNYYFNTGGNTNSGTQSIGPINVSINHSKTSKIIGIGRPKSFGHVPNFDLVGFNCEIQTLLKLLIQKHEETWVVGIVGGGGSGKTTLAKYIYHHPHIKTHYNRKIWVCISQSWDKTNILNQIWSQAIGDDPAATEMRYDQLVRGLHHFLSSMSYLVILDDIWCIDAWNDISPAFPKYKWSKVVITTRNKVIPNCIDPIVHIVETKLLDDEESYELFKRRVFCSNENISHKLLELGVKMVKKCKGLPLAIVALAGALRMDKSQSSWERISKRLTHSLLNMQDASTQGVVKEVLGLSYYELPHYLKPCVLYLRVFPEDYVIKSQVLIKMWIAECLINHTEDDAQVFIAEVYINEMVQRCIIEVVKTNFKGQVSRFRIHDLIRQMFVDIDQKRGFLKDPLRFTLIRTLYGEEQNNFSKMSESQSIANLERILGSETKAQVRSIMLLNYLLLSEAKLKQLFEKFRLLRVLVLRDLSINHKVPEEIGNLIHLRYLELGGLMQLADSIGNLRNLWTLDMRNICSIGLVEINFDLFKLKELRHLYFPYKQYWLKHFEVGKLKKLKTLWNVQRGKWLPALSADLCDLRVHNILSKEPLEVVFRTPSITSNNIQTLEVCFSAYELHDMNILTQCRSLKKLVLDGIIKGGIPIVFPPSLFKLEIRSTNFKERKLINIISKSCPSLKILIFGRGAYMESELVYNANSLLQLEKLTLNSQPLLRLWIIEKHAMPSLRHLTIEDNRHLDLNREGWTFISNIPQLTYLGYSQPTKFENNLRLIRNRMSQSSDVYVTNYGNILIGNDM